MFQYRKTIMKKRAFTLIELLVVIAIISLLVSILLPSLNKARDLAKDVACKSNLRNIGISLSLYTEDSNGDYPAANEGSWGGNDTWKHVLQDYGSLEEGMFWCSMDEIPVSLYLYGSYLINSFSWVYGIAGNNINDFANTSDKIALAEGKHGALYSINGLIGAHANHNVKYTHDGKANALWMDTHVGAIEEGEITTIDEGRKYFDYRY